MTFRSTGCGSSVQFLSHFESCPQFADWTRFPRRGVFDSHAASGSGEPQGTDSGAAGLHDPVDRMIDVIPFEAGSIHVQFRRPESKLIAAVPPASDPRTDSFAAQGHGPQSSFSGVIHLHATVIKTAYSRPSVPARSGSPSRHPIFAKALPSSLSATCASNPAAVLILPGEYLFVRRAIVPGSLSRFRITERSAPALLSQPAAGAPDTGRATYRAPSRPTEDSTVLMKPVEAGIAIGLHGDAR